MATKKIPSYISVFFVLCTILLLGYVMVIGKSVLIPLLLGGYIAMLLVPICNRLEKWKFPPALSAFTALAVSIIALLGVFYFFFLQIKSFSKDFDDIEGRLTKLLSGINDWSLDTFGIELGVTLDMPKEQILNLLKDNSQSLADAVLNTAGSLTIIILLPVFIFLFLIYRDHLEHFVIKVFNHEDQAHVKKVLLDTRKVIQSYIIGMFKVMGILMVLYAIAFFILGLKHAVFFAVFAAILNIIPYVGPFIGAIFPILFALLTKDSLLYPLGVLIAYNVIQTVEGNVLTPKIVGSNVSLNPLFALLALLIGGALWGVIGMIVFIPTAAIVKLLLDLHPTTKPYAYLMGEDVDEDDQIKRPSKLVRRNKRAAKEENSDT